VKSWLVVLFFSTQQDTTDQLSGKQRTSLSVRFLVSGAGTWTTELLGFAATRIRYQQTAVIIDEDVLDLLFGGFVYI
jgi:hypothetical protein